MYKITNKGKEMYALAYKILPYKRSITGRGVKKTLKDFTDI